MKVLHLLSIVVPAYAYPDFFTFGESDFKEDTFGPEDWDLVRCKDVDDCVSCASKCFDG